MESLLWHRFSLFISSPKFKSLSLPLSLHNQNPSKTENLIHSPIPIHRLPWIILPKVTGETLVFVSSILTKRYVISISFFCTWVFICVCVVELTCMFFFFFSCLWQIFAASRLDINSAWQMPQVVFFFFGFTLRCCNLIAFETKFLCLLLCLLQKYTIFYK